MRIGISSYPTYGGSGVVASELALALAERGEEVHVVSYAVPPRILARRRDNLSFHKVEVRHYPLFEFPPYSLALATRIVEIARRHELDVMHVHYAVPNAVSAVLAREILKPKKLSVVTTLHGTDVTLVGNDPSYLETTRYGVVQSDAVTAVSSWLRDRTRDQLGVDCPIDIVPNFVDESVLERPDDDVGARRWAKSEDERLFVHISNYRRVKRALDVVEVFARVLESVPARLLLVGEGPDLNRVEMRARELGVEDSVELLGQLPRVEEALWGADLFLLPSESESFGLAALEALACEVPVIGTAVGGLPGVVVDGVHGRLLPVGDVDGMATAALELLHNEPMRSAYAKAARAHALRDFERDLVVEQYRQIYQRVMS